RDHDPIRHRIGSWHFFKPDVAAARIKLPHKIGALHCKPECSPVVEYRRVWIAGARIRHSIFANLTGLRIQFSNVPLAVSGEPDVSVVIGNQSVRPGISDLESEFLELPGAGIETSQFVCQLLREPERTIGREGGI